MASFVVQIDREFIDQLTNLGDKTEKTIEMMMNAGGDILQEVFENEISSSHNRTGELADNIYVSEGKRAIDREEDGWKIWAYPAGRATKKRRKSKVYKRSRHGTVTKGRALYNSDKLFFLEYGTSKQRPTPVIGRVVSRAENRIVNKMLEIYKRELNK